MKLLITLALLLSTVLAPEVALADGLVPCGDEGQQSCETCHFYELTSNVFEWIFGIAAVIMGIIIVVGGTRLATSGGNSMAKRDARKWIGTAIVGFVLVGSAWALIEILIGVLSGVEDPTSIWVPLQCEE